MVVLDSDRERVALGSLIYNIDKLFSRCKKYKNLNFLNYLDEKKVVKKDSILENTLSGREKNRVGEIAQRANNYSTGEIKKDESLTPLTSVFSHISLGNIKKASELYRYKVGKFSEKNIFPERIKNYSPNEIEGHIDGFLKEVGQIKTEDFKTFYTKLLDIIKKYCWCIPMGDSDISLYDSLKMASAIGLALFESEAEENQFILLGGDISGIQKYIYGLEHSSGAAKRLRARSFFIKLLSDIATYKIIEELDLLQSNIVISSGGKFYILAPNKKEIGEKLDSIRDEINHYLFKNYYGELFLNIQRIELSGKDLRDSFSEKYDMLNDKLDEGKHRKFVKEVVEIPVLENELYGVNKKVSQCKICGKTLTESPDKICENCVRDVELGGKLTRMKKLTFYSEENNKNIDFDISLFGIGCKILGENQEVKGIPIMVHYYDEGKDNGDYPCVRDFYGGYAPVNDKGEVIEFGDIANESNSGNLAIIKGDVDNLGLIFSLGLKNNGNTSIAKISTLSRMMDSFFSYWLVDDLKKKKYHYVVYAGGDDFMIVAPWDRASATAKDINDKFKEFTGYNSDITLTCGISITKPKDPIYFSSQWATEAEEKGKDSGKNGFVLFDRYIPWSKYDELFDLVDFLDRYMVKDGEDKEKGIYNQSFLYRLLNYTTMAEKYSESGDSRDLRYVSQFSYDIGRNLYPVIKKEKINPLEDERIMRLSSYFGIEGISKEGKEDIFIDKYMRVVLNYVIRKNRGEDNDSGKTE